MNNVYAMYLAIGFSTMIGAMDNPPTVETPLTYAVLNGELERVEQLLAENQFLANTPNSEGVPPLFMTTVTKCKEGQLIMLGKDADGVNKCVCSEITQRLLFAGANINYQLQTYGTPLMAAIEQCHFPVVKKLIEFAADVNIKRKEDGMTALALAKKWGCQRTIAELEKVGAK